MSRPRRGYSEEEISEAVKEAAIRRADARLADRLAHPERWTLVSDPEFPEFGLEWRVAAPCGEHQQQEG